MRDDLDYEEQTRGKKSKDMMITSIIKNAFAPLVLADTAKNSLLSRDHKVKDEIKKSLKDYPDSVFDNNVEGIDVVTSHFPKFASENPGTAAAAGMGLDFVDPLSYGALKAKSLLPKGSTAKKVANILVPTVASATMELGDKAAESGVKKYIQKLTKKKDIHEVERLAKFVSDNDLRQSLRKPEELITLLDGKRNIDAEKITEGTMDKVGAKITETTRKGDLRGAKPVNRGEVQRKMERAYSSKQRDPNIPEEDVVPEVYSERLQKLLKPYEKKVSIVEGVKPAKPDLLPGLDAVDSDLGSKIETLAKEIDSTKAKKMSQSAQKIERAKAEKVASVKNTAVDPMAEAEAKLAAQKAERDAAEKGLSKENDKTNQEILALLLKKKAATDKVDPMDIIPVPKAQKGLPAIPAKEALDIQAHNKKAAVVNQKYLQTKELETQLPSIEEQIAALKSKQKSVSDLEVPPPMPKEALDVKPPVIHDVEVPPAVPDEAIGSLEEKLAQMADLKAQRAKLKDSNSKIAKENAMKSKDFGLEFKKAAPAVKVEMVDRLSKLQDAWELKKNLNKRLSELDQDRNLMELPAKKLQAKQAAQELDQKIIDSLKDINFPEGNAAELYKALNKEYGTQADFLEMVIDDTINTWKGGKSRGGVLPAVSGGVAAALAAKGFGANVPLAAIAGTTTGEAVRRSMFSSVPEIQAKWGDKLSKPEMAHLVTQGVIEGAEYPTQKHGSDHTREAEVPAAKGEQMSIGQDDMSPELRNLIQGKGRKPQSVEEIPGSKEATDIMAPEPTTESQVDQKMTETLMPPKPQFDPYVNEEILNTPLPRDSNRLLKNKVALLAKLQQVAPDKVPMLKDMIEHDPEGLKEAAPKIAMMFPAVFERDKYGMFDGKIVDPMMQQKFLVDLSQDESMSAIEKANMAMKIYRQESIN